MWYLLISSEVLIFVTHQFSYTNSISAFCGGGGEAIKNLNFIFDFSLEEYLQIHAVVSTTC